MPQPIVLSIAGFDPSSGAGVTADIKTAAAHGCFAVTCITALTVQTTQGVRRVEPVLGEVVHETLFELAADLPIAAVRIGMLGNGEVAEAVAGFLETARPPNVILDPIVNSSSGADLLDDRALRLMRERLLPLSTLVTPNMAEAAVLTGEEVVDLEGMRRAATRLRDMGCRNVVVTGGHLPGGEAVDLLFWMPPGDEMVFEEEMRGPHLDSLCTHGTGCAFATSVACHLARGMSLPESVAGAKRYVLKAIEAGEAMGHGTAPVGHLWPFKR